MAGMVERAADVDVRERVGWQADAGREVGRDRRAGQHRAVDVVPQQVCQQSGHVDRRDPEGRRVGRALDPRHLIVGHLGRGDEIVE